MDADDGCPPLVEPNDDSAYENLFKTQFENDVRRGNGGDPSWIAQLNVSELREQLAGFGLAIAGPKHELADRLRTCLYSTASSSTADRRVCSPTPLVASSSGSGAASTSTSSAPISQRAGRLSPRKTPPKKTCRSVTATVVQGGQLDFSAMPIPDFPMPDSQESAFSFGAHDVSQDVSLPVGATDDGTVVAVPSSQESELASHLNRVDLNLALSALARRLLQLGLQH